MENFGVLHRPQRPFPSHNSRLMLWYLLANFAIHLNAFIIQKSNSFVQPSQNVANNTISPSNKVCKTKGCIDTANIFLKNMNKSVNPCIDFYEFTCGNFIKHALIQDSADSINTFGITQDIITEQIKTLLESKIENNAPQAYKTMQDYYKLCMDTAQVEKNSENDFRDILKSLNGWPVLEGKLWNETKFDWKNTTYNLRKIGYSIDFLLSVNIGPDRSNSSKYIVYLDQSELSNDQEHLSEGLNNPVIQAYLKYMVEFAVLFGAAREQANKELVESINFEIELAKICLSSVERSDEAGLFTKMKIQDLQNNYRGIPWLEYVNRILEPQRPLTVTDEVMVGPKKFFENIGPLLTKTPKRVIANYIIGGVADSSSGLLSERIRNLSIAYNSIYSGRTSHEERWKVCADSVNNDMNIALGSMYVRKFFDESSKNDVSEILKNIRSSYRRIIQKVDWMGQNTKNIALDKLEAMETFIGYPREFLDNKKVDECYKNITIDPKSFIKTKLGFGAAEYAYNLKQFEQPINKTNWITHSRATTVNAYYRAAENSIEFPAGILQGLFFSKDRPKYLNYGGIGNVIGHEMTHGFDDEGSHYDKHGTFMNWWDAETKRKFDKKAKSIVEQYSKYKIPDININISGELTEGENIADNGGYKEAYLAYLDWSEHNEQEPGLPGLPYTPRQLFWISAGNVWCEKDRPETAKNLARINPHSPGKFRTNGPVSNRLEFAIDFNCSLGSPMNPQKKYGVW